MPPLLGSLHSQGWLVAACHYSDFNFVPLLITPASVLPLDGTQLGVLIKASQMQWKDVEPAIFGTLLERAPTLIESSGVLSSTSERKSASYCRARIGLASNI